MVLPRTATSLDLHQFRVRRQQSSVTGVRQSKLAARLTSPGPEPATFVAHTAAGARCLRPGVVLVLGRDDASGATPCSTQRQRLQDVVVRVGRRGGRGGFRKNALGPSPPPQCDMPGIMNSLK
jgi:hypothetical protein